MSDYILSLDPSGNFNEGKGTTGWCLTKDKVCVDAGEIYASEYPTQMSYWDKVITLIYSINKNTIKDNDTYVVLCEDYRLYETKASEQINSNLETPQIIGAIKYTCYKYKIPLYFQMAAEVKTRWSDDILFKTERLIRKGKHAYTPEGVLIQHHSRDAYRHVLHYINFKLKTNKEIPKINLEERSNY